MSFMFCRFLESVYCCKVNKRTILWFFFFLNEALITRHITQCVSHDHSEVTPSWPAHAAVAGARACPFTPHPRPEKNPKSSASRRSLAVQVKRHRDAAELTRRDCHLTPLCS